MIKLLEWFKIFWNWLIGLVVFVRLDWKNMIYDILVYILSSILYDYTIMICYLWLKLFDLWVYMFDILLLLYVCYLISWRSNVYDMILCDIYCENVLLILYVIEIIANRWLMLNIKTTLTSMYVRPDFEEQPIFHKINYRMAYQLD